MSTGIEIDSVMEMGSVIEIDSVVERVRTN